MEPKNVIMVIILCLMMLAVGGVGGYLYHEIAGVAPGQAGAPLALADAQAISVFASQVVSDIQAFGKVTKINGRNITLSQNTESMTVTIEDGLIIHSFNTERGINEGVAEAVDFKNISIGDDLRIRLKVMPSGQVMGISVVVMPPASILEGQPPVKPVASPSPTVLPKKK